MILKYALFTLIVSVIPMIMILKDLSFTHHLIDIIRDNCVKFNFELINNILSTGVYTFLTVSEDDLNDAKNRPRDIPTTQLIFTDLSLKPYTGKDGRPLYLAILGEVFDVSKGAKHYGPGQAYNAFTGRDASRAFITGDFTEGGLIDDVMDLSLQELRSLNDWLKFYYKDYTYIGKLEGRFYDKNGKTTGYHHKLLLKIQDADNDEMAKNRFKLMFPPCNVEWTPEEGSRVWCSQQSGGIDRDWIGVPRKLYQPGAETYRCACINTHHKSGDKSMSTANLMEYEDCHPLSTTCYVHS